MRGLFRPIRTERPAGSYYYPDRAAAGLLFPVALCGTVPASAIDGNSGVVDRPGDRTCDTSATTVYLRGRREKLEAPPHRGAHDSPCGSGTRYLHASGWLRAVESGD